jgi:hypothetical protein
MDDKRRAEIEGYLAEIAQRHLAADKRMDEYDKRFKTRMDRTEARLEREEALSKARSEREEAQSKARFERAEARMEKFDKRLEATRKIIQYGMKLIVRIEQRQDKSEKQLDRLERLMLGSKGRHNGSR